MMSHEGEKEKKMKKLQKVLRQIDELKAKQESGVQLEKTQEGKMEREEQLRAELAELESSYAAGEYTTAPPVVQQESTRQQQQQQPVPGANPGDAAPRPMMSKAALKNEKRKAARRNPTAVAIETELARVKDLTEQERALVGKIYTDPKELWRALDAGGGSATCILRASWFKKQRGGRMPKRGDELPPEATITVAELRDISRRAKCKYGALPVIALSHFWRTMEHPDPDGETMELIVAALTQRWHEFEDKGVTDLGILVDWCALWQAPRETPEKEAAFEAGLEGINLWYAHQGTTVWLVTGGADRTNGLTYWDKGWTSFEFALAMLIKPANSSQIKDWPQVVDLGKEGDAQTAFARPALSEPLAFFSGHAYGDKTYTNGADRDKIVAPKYRDTMFQVMGGVETLNLNKLNWGDEEIKALAVVLPLCGQLRELYVGANSFGDTGMIALVDAIVAMASLKVLWLNGNQIGKNGVTALKLACARCAAHVAQSKRQPDWRRGHH
ncbi:hypothetical protein Ctob_002711 [Chrysochromulina tobinii]|uniref:Uncharacterized protein n=1 Tax=Chrysochromulina tobinii TaxID=1460289 RepID=A0A0M0JAM8_9EUKA|nr:hypothetical protein Ctob_002711 [Chrysochromulina tobinii]|eukprot:KOO23649.1 hypothetical protein Ctob_002711 [Chrysochromulina sp. CCMP291]